jgi:hypothetical protein
MATHKTERQKRKAARLIAQGFGIKDSLSTSGWSGKQAAKGKAALSKELKKMIGEEKKKRASELMALGVAYDPTERKALVRGKIVENILTGVDSSVQSLKMAGNDSELDMFTADTLVQAVIIQAPDRPLAAVSKPDEPKMLEE